MEQEQRCGIFCKMVNQYLATRRQMSSVNKMQNQRIPSKIIQRQKRLKDGRSVSMSKVISYLLKTFTRSVNNYTSSVAGFFSGVDNEPKEEFNQNAWRKESGICMIMTSNHMVPQMNINLWEEQYHDCLSRRMTH